MARLNRHTNEKVFVLVACGLGFLATSCSRAIGPKLIVRDRAEYSGSLSDSWKDQTLLNIVKLRYVDPPTFIDIGSIVSSYTLSQGASVGGTLQSPDGSAVLGLSGSFSNTPTVTYTPLTGSKFIRNLMIPLPPQAVFFSIRAGLPADTILFPAVSSINGLRNQEASINGITTADSEFHQVRALLRKIQASGAVRMYVKMEAEKPETSIVAFRSKNISPETLADIHELRRLLHLNSDLEEFRLVFGATPANDSEIAVVTRSVLDLMKTMALQVEVPPEHLAQHRATPGFEQVADQANLQRLIRIHSARSKPSDSFVTVNYRNTWFWIDDGDLQSKQVFSLMLMLFTLADTNPKDTPPPIVTIPSR